MFEVRPGYRVIQFEGGRIRVLRPTPTPPTGLSPTLAIVDELHRHPSGALYGVFRDGLLGDGQMITISTAGATFDSPLGQLLERARAFDVEQVKKRRTYTSPDGSFVLVEWALDTDDDHQDLRLVKDVNPAPWHTKTSLRRRRIHRRPRSANGSLCGIWTAGDGRPPRRACGTPPASTSAAWISADTVYLAPSGAMQRWRSPRCATTARLP